jgi:serine protease Do
MSDTPKKPSAPKPKPKAPKANESEKKSAASDAADEDVRAEKPIIRDWCETKMNYFAVLMLVLMGLVGVIFYLRPVNAANPAMQGQASPKTNLPNSVKSDNIVAIKKPGSVSPAATVNVSESPAVRSTRRAAIQPTHLTTSYNEAIMVIKDAVANIKATTVNTTKAPGVQFRNPLVPATLFPRAPGPPPIGPNDPSPHKDGRTNCAGCHQIVDPNAQPVALATNTGLVSIGSGFVITEKGHIITNFHVIQDAKELLVTVLKKDYPARVVAQDKTLDVAILALDNTTGPFQPALFGNSELNQVGDIVLAIGSPFGLDQTVTAGIISDEARTIEIAGRVHSDMIQTDAAINMGNSGGPLVNLSGAVIGINTAIYSINGDFTGIGFAVPINHALSRFPQVFQADHALDLNLIPGESVVITKAPKPLGAFLGIEFAALSPSRAQELGVTQESGLVAKGIYWNSPAWQAGLTRGDLITQINGRRLSNMTKLTAIKTTFKPGQNIEVSMIRGNQSNTVIVALAAEPLINSSPGVVATGQIWAGISVANIGVQQASKFGIPDTIASGVVVTKVKGRPVGAGLLVGDVIHQINSQHVHGLRDFNTVTQSVSLDRSVVLSISRRGRMLVIAF